MDDGGWSMDGLLTLYLIVIYNSSEINVYSGGEEKSWNKNNRNLCSGIME